MGESVMGPLRHHTYYLTPLIHTTPPPGCVAHCQALGTWAPRLHTRRRCVAPTQVGNGAFTSGNAMAQAHFSLWCLLKAPLLLGNNLSAIDAPTLAILSNAAALAVNQDPLGVQGRRVAVFPPRNTSIADNGADSVAIIAACNASRPTQIWRFANQSGGPPDLLYLQPCNATSQQQQWVFSGSGGVPGPLQNAGTGQCVDASVQFDPGMLVSCSGSQAQQWVWNTSSLHVASVNPYHCLDVFDFRWVSTHATGRRCRPEA